MLSATTVNAQDLFWVGDSGNWNDPAHWSLTSGGAGGAGIPGPESGTYFDEHSFTNPKQTVTIWGNATCAFLDAGTLPSKGKLVLSDNAELSVQGDFVTGDDLLIDFQGDLIVTTYDDVIFDSGENVFEGNVAFVGPGNVTLYEQLLINGDDLSLNCGSFETNGNPIVSKGLYSIMDTEVDLEGSYAVFQNEVDVASNTLFIQGGVAATKGFDAVVSDDSDILLDVPMALPVTCGTSPNEFTIETSVVSDYNGQQVSCNGASDGEATVTVTGGVGPFDYIWIGGSTPGNTANYTDLGPGTYTVLVTDLGQGVTCVSNVQITEPAPITVFSFNYTPPTCSGVCNGSGMPIVIGGVPGYDFTWTSGETTQMATQLCEGNNTMTVTDLNGCSFDSTFVVELDELFANVTITDIDCGGTSTGEAISNPMGGAAPYTYSWTSGDTGNQMTGQPAGDYTLTVTDNNGCSVDTTFTISEQPPVVINVVSTTDESCAGAMDGEIDIDVTGGTAPYTYAWTGPNGYTASTEDITGLEPGTYTIDITDDTGCSQSSNVVIDGPQPMSVDAVVVNVLCFGAATGSIDITISGGVAPYAVNWTGPNGFISALEDINGLEAGDYILDIVDNDGCTHNETISITEAPEMVLDIVVTDPLCAGDLGSIDLSITGGTAPITVAWTGPNGFTSTNEDIANLEAGTYDVIATDAAGCVQAASTDVVEPDPIQVSETITPLDCSGDPIAGIDVDITGGTPGYTTTWTGPNGFTSTDEDISGLEGGTYSLNVTDAQGCVFTVDYTIDLPVVLDVTGMANDVSCNGELSGYVNLTISGGQSPITIAWTGPNGFTSSNEDIIGLGVGTYDYVVTDALGCSVNGSFDINEPDPITVDATIQDILCNSNSDGAIDITINGGVGPYTVGWNGPVGYSSFDEDISGLYAGDYDLFILDANGCFFSATYTVSDADAIDVSTNITHLSCFGAGDGEISVNVTGGTPPYTVTWPDSSNGLVWGGLSSGTYSVIVVDQNGCGMQMSNLQVIEPDSISVSETIVNIQCFGDATGEISVVAAGGTGVLSLDWTGPNGFTSDQTSINGLVAGDYDLTITDENGCSRNETYTISEAAEIVITLTPDALACEGDLGDIEATITGGTAPYTFSWDGPNGFTSTDEDLIAVESGTYTLTVTDALGCVMAASTDLVAPNPIDVQSFVTDLDCTGDPIGAIELLISGGVAPYTVIWTGPNGFTSTDEDIFGLEGGDYDVTVQDANGCEYNETFTLSIPNLISVDVVISNPLCFGEATGAIDITINGGTAPVTWIWSGPNGFTSPSEDISNLEVGDYTLDITDGAGCVYSEIFTISETPELTATTTATDALCNGDANGTIDLSVSGGTAPYAFDWTGPNGFVSTDEDIADLEAGDYDVIITDANGCTVAVSATVGEPVAITLDPTIVNSTCGNNSGQIALVITGGVDPVNVNWMDDLGADLGSGLNLIDLPAGVYTATATDANGCAVVEVYTISDSDASAITANVIDPLCAGDVNGAIDIDVTGDVMPYTFDWTGPNGFVSVDEDIADLEAGDYIIIVTDDLGCTSSETITVTDPQPIFVSAAIADIFCNGGNNGAIDITVTGGTGNLFIAWTGPNGFYVEQEDISGLEPGDYSVGISDENGCSVLELYTVIESTNIDVDIQQSAPMCFGEVTGWVDVTLNGGTPPYTFDWTGPNGFVSSNEDLTNLEAGIYDLIINDDAGCGATAQVEIVELTELAVNPDITTPSCMMANGSILANPTGGSGNYTYVWYDMSNGGLIIGTDALLDAVGAGVFEVEVTDDAGCMTSEEITLSDSDATADITVQDVTCFGAANGTIALTITGGNPPFTYDWTGPNGFVSTDQNLTDLEPGSYMLTATDALGCTLNETVNVDGPEELLADVTPGNVLCAGDTNGSFLTNVTGGTAPYTYQWFYNSVIASTDQNPTGLEPGCYNLMVTDANFCTVEVNVCIDEPVEIEVTASLTHNPCYGENVGEILTTITGGNGGYNWSWTGPDSLSVNTQDINALGAGVYNLSITDLNGCVLDTSFTITEGAALDVQYVETSPLCAGEANGTIALNVNGGSGVQSVDWTSNNGYIGTGLAIADLEAGVYYYALLDSAGCTFNDSIVLVDPSLMVVNATASQVTCFGNADASIEVEIEGGNPGYAFDWTASNGFTSNDQNISGLDTGMYILTVTDLNGCVMSFDTLITQPTQLNVQMGAVTQTSCEYTNDGSIDMLVTGGTPNYDVLWTGTNGFNAATEDIVDLETGFYTITVMDSLGCIAMMDSIEISSAVVIDVFTTEDVEACFGAGPHDLIGTQTGASNDYWTDIDGNTLILGGVLSVDPEAGVSEFIYVAEEAGCVEMDTVSVEIYDLPYVDAGDDQLIFLEELTQIGGNPTTDGGNDIYWTPNILLSDSTESNPYVYELNEDMTFTVTVSDENGCIAQDSMMIEVIPEIDLNSGFSPNSDGMNDFWEIGHIHHYPNTTVQVYNRWGDVVFNSKGYAEPWDGNLNGNPLPIGTYYYLIEINEPEFQEVMTGPVTILR